MSKDEIRVPEEVVEEQVDSVEDLEDAELEASTAEGDVIFSIF